MLIEYSGLKPEQRKNWLRTLNGMGYEVIILTDKENSPCITACKRRVRKDFGGIAVEQYVVVVVSEIESWYIAGATNDFAREYGITIPS